MEKSMVMKLELERLYENYCKSNSEGFTPGEDKFIDMLSVFVDFRLSVSGGSETSMGSIGCGSVGGFLNEIFLFDSMMSDWAGAYRGDCSYECLEGLIGLLNESSLDENVKNEIVNKFKSYYGIDEDEEMDY